LIQWLKLSNFLPFQFLPNLFEASHCINCIQSLTALQAYIRAHSDHGSMDTAFEQFLYLLLN